MAAPARSISWQVPPEKLMAHYADKRLRVGAIGLGEAQEASIEHLGSASPLILKSARSEH